MKKICLSFTIMFIVLFLSCSRNGGLGPKIKLASENFQIEEMTFSQDTFNINEKPKVMAKFNEDVSWKVVFRGNISKAEKHFEGLSDEITEDVFELWDGRSSNVYFFKRSEKVKVELYVLGIETPFEVGDFFMQDVKIYHNKVISGVKHIVVDDFNPFDSLLYLNKVDSLAAGVSPDRADVETAFRQETLIWVEGGGSFYMRGRDINRNSWSGGINSEPLTNIYRRSGNVSNLLIDSGIDPEKLFFNVFVYGTGHSATNMQIKVYELDAKSGGATEHINSRQALMNYVNTVGIYSQAENDGWIYNISIDWKGWKLVSIPYSAFQANQDPLAGGNGDRKKESWRICGIGMSLLSIPEGNFTELYTDFLVITQNGTFKR